MIRLYKQKGFTLVELIVSMAILGIIAVSFLPMFTNSFHGIVSAGNKSKDLYLSQEAAENKLVEGATSSTKTIDIVFPGIPDITIEQTGEQFTNGSIVFFIPKY